MGLGLLGMKVLIAAYLVLACVFAYEGRWPYALYWISAGSLTACVLAMGQR